MHEQLLSMHKMFSKFQQKKTSNFVINMLKTIIWKNKFIMFKISNVNRVQQRCR